MKPVRFLFLFFIIFSFIPLESSQAAGAAAVSSPYLFNFNTTGTLPEAGSAGESWSPYWWVNSGALLLLSGERGSTIQGALLSSDPWRTLYAISNPQDTDNGYHPQNIFRLFSRSQWGNARQEVYFLIKKDNLSVSANRNASNGLLLFNRYQDGDNLYYTGIRVDGSAIIKKKKNSVYYTMAESTGVYPGNYNKTSAPNLLPKNKWIGLRSELLNLPNGFVEIRLYIDKGWQGLWQLVVTAVDNGQQYGGSAFTNDGLTGIRTDFMDVEFENFRVRDITGFSY